MLAGHVYYLFIFWYVLCNFRMFCCFILPLQKLEIYTTFYVNLSIFVLQSAAMEETVIWEQHTVTLHRVGNLSPFKCLSMAVCVEAWL